LLWTLIIISVLFKYWQQSIVLFKYCFQLNPPVQYVKIIAYNWVKCMSFSWILSKKQINVLVIVVQTFDYCCFRKNVRTIIYTFVYYNIINLIIIYYNMLRVYFCESLILLYTYHRRIVTTLVTIRSCSDIACYG